MRTRQEIQAEIAKVRAAGASMNRLQNEGGQGYNHTNEARLSELAAELQAVKEAEWTVEVTTARRAAWNAEVRAGNSNPVALAAKIGYNLDDLRAAVKRHGL
jgi:hypothetical protein